MSRGSAGDVMFVVPSHEIAEELRLIEKLDRLSLDDSGGTKMTKKPLIKQHRSVTTNSGRAVDGLSGDDHQDSLRNDIPVADSAMSGGISLSSTAVDLPQTLAASTMLGDLPVAPHGQDVVVLDITSAGDVHTDVSMVLPKTDTSVPSSGIAHCSDMIPDLVETHEKTGVEQKTGSRTEALVELLDEREELQTERDQQVSVEDDHSHDVDTASCARSVVVASVVELTVADSGISQEDMPKLDNHADVVPCEEHTQETSSCDRGYTSSQESVPEGGVVLKREEIAKGHTEIYANATTASAISNPDGLKVTSSDTVLECSCQSSSQALANIQRLVQMQSRDAHKGSSPRAKKPGCLMDTFRCAVREWKTAATVSFLHGEDSDDDADDNDVRPGKMTASVPSLAGPTLDGEEKMFQMKVCKFYRGVYPADPRDTAISPSKVCH